MKDTQAFPLGDILSITTGRLVSPTHMDGVYAILNYMTRDNLFPHQLPRALEQYAPLLLQQHPQLAGADLAMLDELLAAVPKGSGSAVVQAACNCWVNLLALTYGATLPVERLPLDNYTSRDPITELAEMVGEERVLVVRPE